MAQKFSLPDWDRNLRELGCEPALVEGILRRVENRDPAGAALLLRRRRSELLDQLHQAGRQVDLADFLLYRLKQMERTEPKTDGNAESDPGMG